MHNLYGVLNSAVIFDQHAADERIRLEELRQKVGMSSMFKLVEKYTVFFSHNLVEYKGLVRRSKDNYFSGCRERVGMYVCM